jgi:AcrR family transcriptional regulator
MSSIDSPQPTPRRRKPRRPPPLADASAWESPAPRQFVTRDQIVHEALGLLDEVGVDGLTTRRLAERLGIQSPSLYNHVRDKQELLTLVANAICQEVGPPPARAAWNSQLWAIGNDYRRVLLRHRDAARILLATLPLGPNRLQLIERVLAVLRSAGFSPTRAADAANIFNVFVTGFVQDETRALPRTDLAEGTLEELNQQVRQSFKSLPADRYPSLVALADELVESDMDRQFSFGLNALLSGLEACLSLRASHKGA